MKWVKLARYCELTGDTPGAVRMRRHRGEWRDGEETQIRKRHIWVNLEAVEKWLENERNG